MIKKIDVYSGFTGNYQVDREKSKEITGYASIDKPWQKYYSKEAIEEPILPMTAYEYMKSENQDNLTTTAIEYYGTKISFKKFIKKIDNAAKAFYNLGVRKGDVITVMSVATPELEIAFYALNKLGAVINLIDVRSDSATVKNYLNEVNSKLVISLDNFLPVVDEIIDETKVEKVITVSPINSVSKKVIINEVVKKIKEGKKETADEEKEKQENDKRIKQIKEKSKYVTWNNFILNSVPGFFQKIEYPTYTKNTVAALVHTGGTTGISKTVKLSNENFNAMAVQYKSLNTGYNKKDTFLNGIVPFVAYGIVLTIHMPMCLGITNIIAPILSPKEFTDFMIKYQPNHTATIPSYVEDFISDSRANKMSWKDLKHIGIGGDSLSWKKEQEMMEFLKLHNSAATIDKGYGMSELSSSAVSCMGEVNKKDSLGIPLPKNTIGIFKEDTDEELQYNEVGEVCITGPTLMLGYLNNDDEERKVIKIHSDGTKWVHSGDLGIIDKDGFLFLKGRIKRMIIHGGFKLYPGTIEDIILKNENVDKCCVIAVPSDEFGSNAEAHIVLKTDKAKRLDIIKKELVSLCQKELPEYSQPSEFIFSEELPLTSVGKVDYKKVEQERIKKLTKKLD